jgi:hypothetical protein
MSNGEIQDNIYTHVSRSQAEPKVIAVSTMRHSVLVRTFFAVTTNTLVEDYGGHP